jgi:hypothetical protein
MSAPHLTKGDRYHFSARPLRRVVQRPYVQEPHTKPSGLWYSVGSEWHDWVKTEMPNWHGDVLHVSKLTLDMRRILVLDTVAKVRFFAETTKPTKAGSVLDRYHVSWRKIERAGYAGIEIAPYQFDLRFDMAVPWYYPWDVASGCIWDVSAIKQITYLGKLP